MMPRNPLHAHAAALLGGLLLLNAVVSPSALATFPEGIRTFSGEISGTYARADGTRFVVVQNQRAYDAAAGRWVGFRCGELSWIKVMPTADPALFETAREAAFYGRTVSVVAEECGQNIVSPVLQALTAWHPVKIREDLIYPW